MQRFVDGISFVRTVAILVYAMVPGVLLAPGQAAGEPGQANSQEIKRLLQQQIADNHLAGMAAIVIRAGSVVGMGTAGVRRRGERSSIDSSDEFQIGSNTKAFTATMIARLVEAGTLQWSTRPLDIFPELNDTIHPAFKEITMVQLLSHHAGIPAYSSLAAFKLLPKMKGTATEQRARFATWVLGKAPAVPPGTTGLYSNAGYTIAAAMAERVTGLRWEALMDSLVLAPLQVRAGYGWALPANRQEPWGHIETKKGLKPVDPMKESEKLPTYLFPAGGMFLSIVDYSRFLQMHLRLMEGKPEKFLTMESMQRLHSSMLHDEYSLGWGEIEIGGVQSSTHAGSAGSFYAVAALQPQRDVGVAVFANSGGERSARAGAAVMDALLLRYR